MRDNLMSDHGGYKTAMVWAKQMREKNEATIRPFALKLAAKREQNLSAFESAMGDDKGKTIVQLSNS